MRVTLATNLYHTVFNMVLGVRRRLFGRHVEDKLHRAAIV